MLGRTLVVVAVVVAWGVVLATLPTPAIVPVEDVPVETMEKPVELVVTPCRVWVDAIEGRSWESRGSPYLNYTAHLATDGNETLQGVAVAGTVGRPPSDRDPDPFVRHRTDATNVTGVAAVRLQSSQDFGSLRYTVTDVVGSSCHFDADGSVLYRDVRLV